MAVKAPHITLDIERIVLDGVPLASRRRFLLAFEEECAAALAETPLTHALPDKARIDLVLAPDASAEAIGRALARGIVSWMSGS
jgi:hypothetical protein